MAEAVRFELTEVVKLRRFSRPVHSTALPRFLRLKPSILTRKKETLKVTQKIEPFYCWSYLHHVSF